jgi:uncharacterized protein (DUF1501 family)
VIGSAARAGLLTEYPPLDGLDERGNLRATADFRGVYAGLLEQWLQADATDVLPKLRGFAVPSLIG